MHTGTFVVSQSMMEIRSFRFTSLGDCRINANYTKHHFCENQAIAQAITVKALYDLSSDVKKREGEKEREREWKSEMWVP